MHTPGHAVVNLALLGSLLGHEGAVLAGAVIPDIPILTLYAYERFRGTPEETIWTVRYQQPVWLAIIHGAHSIPLSAIGAALAWLCGAPGLAALFLSMLAHALCDFPLHAIDAHRHFLPFSHYRFVSPISYWDVRFHGRSVAFVEAVLVLLCSFAVGKWMAPHFQSFSGQVAIVLLVLVNIAYAVNYWRSFLRQ